MNEPSRTVPFATARDPWGDAFGAREHMRRGLYDAIAIARWRILAQSVHESAPHGATVKLDAWNEALGDGCSIVSSLTRATDVVLLENSRQIAAKAAHCQSRVIVGDIRHMPFGHASLGCILDISTSDHCRLEELPSIAAEYHRTLVPGGALLFIHNNDMALPWRIARRLRHVSPAYGGDPPAYYFHPHDATKALENAGFVVHQHKFTNYFGILRGAVNLLPVPSAGMLKALASIELRWQFPTNCYLARQHVLVAARDDARV